MSKTALVAKIKKDMVENHMSLSGDYLVFDKKSNLDYQILTNFTLRELLTHNPVSHTKLNLNLLASLDLVREAFGKPIVIRASYQSPEYHLLSFGTTDSQLFTKGDALSLGVEPDEVDNLLTAVKSTFTPGELGVYKWGLIMGLSKEPREWDTRADTSPTQTIKNFISNDKMKNYLIIGAALVAGWFFFLRKK